MREIDALLTVAARPPGQSASRFQMVYGESTTMPSQPLTLGPDDEDLWWLLRVCGFFALSRIHGHEDDAWYDVVPWGTWQTDNEESPEETAVESDSKLDFVWTLQACWIWLKPS